MDPDATYDAMIQAWDAGDHETAYEHATNLNEWLSRGGFPPAGTSWPILQHAIETVLTRY